MSRNGIDLLAFDQGSVKAPAGCGKTHLIVDALKRHAGAKPILVLTHTNAGVAALRDRLVRADVPASSYRLSTIDGWAILLIQAFPRRSCPGQDLPDLSASRINYPNVRDAAIRLLRPGHISDIIESNYARILVDEYQDCSFRQHSLISLAAKVVPTNVLGDPMQAIFMFGDDRLADWDDEVLSRFPAACELDVPHRWINAGTEPLGRWLLDVRRRLDQGKPIDLNDAPAGVDWVALNAANENDLRLRAARAVPPSGGGSVIVLADSKSPRSQQHTARETPGAETIEAVDMKDLVDFAHRFNDPSSSDAPKALLAFAQKMVRNVDAGSIKAESAMLSFADAPSFGTAAAVLGAVGERSGSSVYRPLILQTCLRALQICRNGGGSFYDAVIRMREESRLAGRKIPRRAVGSTLLLKGLEAEVAVVLNASELDARNLYVAMTRGTSKLVVCAKSNILSPKPNSC